MSKTCRTCRWWGADYHWETDGNCNRIHAAAGTRLTDTLARLYPITSGAYMATNEDFGCTMYEKRKAEKDPSNV